MSPRDKSIDVPAIPASAATGLDPEVRAFMSRLMAGYEAAHRTIAGMCESMSTRAEKAEGIAARALTLQVQLAEEREELVSRRHTRELEAAAAKQRSDAFGAVTKDVSALVPLIIKRLVGVPLTGDDTHGLQDLLGSLSADQIETVVTSGKLELSIGQRQLLTATLVSLADGKPVEKPLTLTEGSNGAPS